MSELRAPALRGDVALAEGAAGATARLAGLRGGFFDDFFDDFLRVEELCFFRVVCGIDSIGATASAASSTTTRALSLR
jgi:hypothetical protein